MTNNPLTNTGTQCDLDTFNSVVNQGTQFSIKLIQSSYFTERCPFNEFIKTNRLPWIRLDRHTVGVPVPRESIIRDTPKPLSSELGIYRHPTLTQKDKLLLYSSRLLDLLFHTI